MAAKLLYQKVQGENYWNGYYNNIIQFHNPITSAVTDLSNAERLRKSIQSIIDLVNWKIIPQVQM